MAYNQENKNEKYACKILLKSNIKDEDDNLRCKREMDILKKMNKIKLYKLKILILVNYLMKNNFHKKKDVYLLRNAENKRP